VKALTVLGGLTFVGVAFYVAVLIGGAAFLAFVGTFSTVSLLAILSGNRRRSPRTHSGACPTECDIS
jgi:hypothetical protein